MTDTQRLIWRDDVEGICPTPDMCFEYGEHVRCGPCAIKQATACGVASDLSLPNLPEVSRQRREIDALRERVVELEGALGRIVNAPMIDHRNPENSAQNIARAILSRPQQGGGEG